MNHLLVVDDSATVRKHLATVLNAAGYQVQSASSGREAIEHYRKHAAELVILDVVMPEMDGIETYRALCKIDPQVKVLAISGQGPRFAGDYLKILIAMGANAVLEKPFTAQAFLSEIQRLVKGTATGHMAREIFSQSTATKVTWPPTALAAPSLFLALACNKP